MTALVNKIYMSGYRQKDFRDVSMITLPKKCSDHRTTSLILHTGKTVVRILSKRLESKIEEFIDDDQFGFRKSKGTRDSIALMRIISERVLDVKEEMCLCFIDWQKTFDHVDWTKLLEMLRNIGVNWRERRLIRNLYMGQSRGNRQCSDWKRSQTGMLHVTHII